MMKLYSVLTYFLYHAFVYESYGLQCRGPNNEPVDWYVIYKLPKQVSHTNDFIKKGLAFMYMTSTNYSEWIFSEVNINDSNSMVAHTLNGLFSSKRDQENLYILYNDQPPYGSKSESKGHTKGVVLADENSGFWLIHSVPHFPYSLQHYVYPHTGVHFGQSFLCISLDFANLNYVGLQLQYNEPHIYAEYVPTSLVQSLPDIFHAANNATINSPPWYNVKNISSLNGAKFMTFAKAGKFEKDLYSDLVSSRLEVDLDVETWPNEPNRLPSDCGKEYEVDNILSISINNPSITFTTTVDHSKWAVSKATDSSKWICIGDINRAEKQTQRGGGTTCINNQQLASLYQKIVFSIQPCKNRYFYKVYYSTYFN